jgi:hypothetical protein
MEIHHINAQLRLYLKKIYCNLAVKNTADSNPLGVPILGKLLSHKLFI